MNSSISIYLLLLWFEEIAKQANTFRQTKLHFYKTLLGSLLLDGSNASFKSHWKRTVYFWKKKKKMFSAMFLEVKNGSNAWTKYCTIPLGMLMLWKQWSRDDLAMQSISLGWKCRNTWSIAVPAFTSPYLSRLVLGIISQFATHSIFVYFIYSSAFWPFLAKYCGIHFCIDDPWFIVSEYIPTHLNLFSFTPWAIYLLYFCLTYIK